MRRVEFVVLAEHAGLRLDQALARSVPELSRQKARVALEIGGVFVDRRRVKVASRRVVEGQRVAVVLGGALERAGSQLGLQSRAREEAALPAHSLLFEDAHLVVVDKPAGLLSAPTPESDRNNLQSVLSRRGGASAPVHVVHRLDLHTSGVLVFAKTDAANRALGEMFRKHELERCYRVLAAGTPAQEAFTERSPIAGRAATTHFTLLQRCGPFSQLNARLETGRTHQIRLHLSRIGHPVLADSQHARREAWHPPRLGLHAERLAFEHPIWGGQRMVFDAPLPSDLADWLAAAPEAPLSARTEPRTSIPH